MIPIEPPLHTYGRVLLDGFIEVFDCKTEIAIQNMEEIIACPKLFKVTVYNWVFKKKVWEIVGHVPLNQEDSQMPLLFWQNIIDPTDIKLVDIYGNETPATIEECRGFGRLSVWNAKNVEERVKAHYEGRIDPNTYISRLREVGEEYP